jgi:PTH1 family peptidyl-tRNA hydrolase
MEMLIVGLGNPGEAYARHRHNVGFMCLDILAQRHGLGFRRTRQRALVAEGTISGRRVALAKPITFMNLSGQAVSLLMRHYNLPVNRILVIYDDLDLPLGRIRIRPSGSSGGHKGLQSIIEHLGSFNFPRIRIGIGRDPTMDPAEYVLSPFRPEEVEVVQKALEAAANAVETVLTHGLEEAMNRFNSWQP